MLVRRHAGTNSSEGGHPGVTRLSLVLGQIGTSFGAGSFTGELCSLGEEDKGSGGRKLSPVRARPITLSNE